MREGPCRAEGAGSSNRTFMELKFDRHGRPRGGTRGSNRTFMELKSGSVYLPP